MKNFKNKRNTKNVLVKPNQRVTVTIKRLGINGEGIGYFHRKLIFIPNALPGELVQADVIEIKPKYLRGKLVQIDKKSSDRVKPKDPYAGNVGGFELEDLAYPAQLRFKRDLVRQSVNRYKPAGFAHYDIRETIGMENPYEYRNKAQFQIRTGKDGKAHAGLFKEGTHDLVSIEECAVQYPVTMKVMNAIVQMINELEIPPYDEYNNSGIIKTVVVRAALNTNDVQVVFVTNTPKLIRKNQLLTLIKEQLPEVTSVMQNVNPGTSPLIWGDETIKLAGNDFIVEKINGLSFKLSARAFLQLNSIMTPKLYDLAGEALNLDKDDRLVDAYSGVGTIGLSLANQVSQVRGMDTIKEAVADANDNADFNHIDNAHFELGKAEDLMPKWIDEGFKPTALVVDPPRVGLDKNLINSILTTQPKKFVYISCNPSTLAQDLRLLTKKYRVDYLQPLDMMPQTPHVEVIAKLTLK